VNGAECWRWWLATIAVATALHGCAAGGVPDTGSPSGWAAGAIRKDRAKLQDEQDGQLADQTWVKALQSSPDGTPVTWNNPATGHSGSVTPLRTYRNAAGQWCRDYREAVSVGSAGEELNGSACQLGNGSWEPQ
jgi:surface antigen